ncbi:sulfite exporter TauE/SafE family protein [Telmatocola sphagniphila]|uniref:Probable membrane transporter protein n=1 Tax=Telmatocola sphagniphila TaxID=1123043 RepID=A0A8E6B4G9_9BACT|nr:sulfite exporter TauE/SafE family protein [Telmatocola sphagniphila]QVL31576.1 sulfite exporter TauE/SafE family protein [Telmatocola sphagniphila]
MLVFLLFVVAFLYSSVGHAGSSGYIAVMNLLGVSTAIIKPSSLSLNILVATIGLVQFGRSRFIPWKLVLPLIALSIPAAFLGGKLSGQLPDQYFKPLLGGVLLFAAWRLVAKPLPAPPTGTDAKGPQIWKIFLVGALLGFFSGVTSTGGGIFLSPLVLFFGWADIKHTAGLSVTFILANSISGLIGQVQGGAELPENLWIWLLAVGMGGLLGSQMGSRKWGGPTLKKLLALVLVIAAAKLIAVLF